MKRAFVIAVIVVAWSGLSLAQQDQVDQRKLHDKASPELMRGASGEVQKTPAAPPAPAGIAVSDEGAQGNKPNKPKSTK